VALWEAWENRGLKSLTEPAFPIAKKRTGAF
jgi:hypothetical protein